MTQAVCLFDIDGTLIDAAGAGGQAMRHVLAEQFDVTEITGKIPAAGRTDAAITADLFRQHDIDPNRKPVFTDAYLQLLPGTLDETAGQVLPGVGTLLELLNDCDFVSLGLLTGNFESAAWTKLKHFELDHYFDFGAFGDVHPDRDDVAGVARKLIAERHPGVRPEEIWVIGDTPSDIRCARAIQARVVAVATGCFAASELAEHEPDVLLESLDRAEELMAVFTNERSV